MDKLNAIRLFCKVIETQSFTAAAQQEQISLAMASKLVAQLEQHLRVRLLQRTTRKTAPTEAGLLYYQRCQPILHELQEAEDCVSNISATLQGKLAISVPFDFGHRFIAPYLSQFSQQYPHLQLQIEFSDRRVDLVAEGYDLVLRIGALPDSSIVAKRIAQSDYLLLASPDYLAKHGTPSHLNELEQHQCLVYEYHQQWQFSLPDQQIKLKPKAKVLSNSGNALLQMAISGLGIINVPRFLANEALASGQLLPLFSEAKQTPLDISLLYPHRRYLSPKVKVAITFFQQLVQEQQSKLSLFGDMPKLR